MVHGITGNLAIWHLEIVPALMSHFRITTYDLRGRPYQTIYADGTYTEQHYDGAGQLLTQRDPAGQLALISWLVMMRSGKWNVCGVFPVPSAWRCWSRC